MFGFIVAIFLGVALLGILRAAGELKRLDAISIMLFGGYLLRLVLQSFLRDIQFFSHAVGGDSQGYEALAQIIAMTWRHTGIHFITSNEFPEMGPTALPANLFALVIYLNDGLTRVGCTAVVAFAAALAVLNIYKLAVQFGAAKRDATLIATLFYFDPAFLHYTADTFKDGLVLCFTIGALASAIRLSFKVSVLHAAIGFVCVVALWYVRFYLVFVTVAPMVVGLVGLGSKSIVRPFMAAGLLLALTIGLVAFTDVLQLASDRASTAFQTATSTDVIHANATGGSGVEFDDGGSPFGALGPKIVYTLFAPFLWSSGSIGFHIGKLDSLLWYFFIYRAIRATRVADRRLLLMLLTFLIPCTLMYAMSMANIGLIVRQRLVIVAATGVFAALFHPKGLQISTETTAARAA